MPRLAGIDIPERKKIYYALQYIHGIGPKVAKEILAKVGVDGDRRANTLDDKELAGIAQTIDAGYVVEGALRPPLPPPAPESRAPITTFPHAFASQYTSPNP